MDAVTIPSGLRAMVFDVGETLVDESRAWAAHAHAAGVPAFTLMGIIGGLIERGHDHREAWQLLGVDPPAVPQAITQADLYPDTLNCLRSVRDAGLVVGIAGNQPSCSIAELWAAGLAADFVASSADWAIAKPSPEFFNRVILATGCEAGEVMYVGDRLDNDILPARAAGMRTAHLRRGPWGHLHAVRPEAAQADLHLQSLEQITRAMTES